MPRLVLSCLVELTLIQEILLLSLAAPCPEDDFNIDYAPQRCTQDGGPSSPKRMTCDSRDPSRCGLRMSSKLAYGSGKFSVNMKAAPGPGTATTFYLYSFDRNNDRSRPWNEIDMEILGKHVGRTSSQIWTNYFIGHAVQYPQFITVPFNISADFHTYDIEVSCCEIKWIVDGNTYRIESILQHEDMKSTIAAQDFQVYMSLWGQGRGTGDWQEMGFLEDNVFQFPLTGYFARVVLPSRKIHGDSTCECKDGWNGYKIAGIIVGAVVGAGVILGGIVGAGASGASQHWDAAMHKPHTPASMLAALGICLLTFALLLGLAVSFRRWRHRGADATRYQETNMTASNTSQDCLPNELVQPTEASDSDPFLQAA